jgi:hypothetical protein
VFRETEEVAGQTVDEQLDNIESDDRSRWVRSAVEAYKASCVAAGEEPTQEDAWLVLLSALQLEDAP